MLLELGWLDALALEAPVILRLREATRLLGDWLAAGLPYATILAFLLQIFGFLASLLPQHARLGHATGSSGASLIQLMASTCMIALVRRSAFPSEKRRMRYNPLSAGLCGLAVPGSVTFVLSTRGQALSRSLTYYDCRHRAIHAWFPRQNLRLERTGMPGHHCQSH
ncbi:hypothetical protein K469DRAFT_374351 [Zopfia rhizophila CBS 207.26]|uniref:Uncharacterized protein n=1 Tax=Zopfia rhizophila CBS 207.26 TaxID=1314779 RepID=A0A6A6EKP7_9PEZI|nr:hypothetical protein K469DRAFT_374351 [Zopfia rhizophila CBS 207.26]